MASNAESVAVWLDDGICEEGLFEELKAGFRTGLPAIRRWVYVTRDDRFLEFVEHNRVDRLTLIMTGSSARRLLGLISLRENIDDVYIFCGRVTSCIQMVQQEPKIRAVCDTTDGLYQAMRRNLA